MPEVCESLTACNAVSLKLAQDAVDVAGVSD